MPPFSPPAGCLTQHNPGVIKHDKKPKGKGLVLTRAHSARAPRDRGIQKCQLFSILLESKFGSPTAIFISLALGRWGCASVELWDQVSRRDGWVSNSHSLPFSLLMWTQKLSVET